MRNSAGPFATIFASSLWKRFLRGRAGWTGVSPASCCRQGVSLGLGIAGLWGVALSTLAAERDSVAPAPTTALTNIGSRPFGEVICTPLSGKMVLPLPVSSNQPASTRRMVARLQQLLQIADPQAMAFLSADLADLYRRRLERTTDLQEILQIKPPYGLHLLNSGQNEAALREFEGYERLMKENRISIHSRFAPELMTFKAMCYLRMGEQENCLVNHNAESCILPIRGGGIHKLQRGSRGAVAALTELLTRYPKDMQGRWLINIAYMTLGEYPDKVPAQWLIPPKVFESDYDIKHFPDVAGKLGLDVDDLAGSVVMEDFDDDGFLDLMVSGWGLRSQLRLFRNNGNGTFTERTIEAGLAGLVSGLNMIHGDYNNDGFADVLVLRGAWLGVAGKHPNSLLRNNGDFTFTDVTEETGLLTFHPTQTAVWFDYNADGWLDIFVGNESTEGNANPCELFRNNGDGTFTECAAETGVAIESFVKGVACGDFNNDGRPDLYLSCRGEPETNYLLRNEGPVESSQSPRGRWRFSNVTRSARMVEPITSFPCWFWDYDNDGWLDLMMTGYSMQNIGDLAADYLGLPHRGERARLYRNNGDGTFQNVTVASGLYKVLHTMGCNFGDLDNDGWLDFYVGTGDPDLTTLDPARMFRNNGGKSFQDVTTSGGFGQIQKGHGIAFGDIDNDGDQDIYSVVGGAYTADNYRNQLFANPGHGNHWLKLKLEGVKSNRPAIGARIKVIVKTEEGERAIYKTVGTGASFGSSPLRQEIGLAQAKSIMRVEILWPTTGKTQVVQGLEMDRFYKIREGEPDTTSVTLASFKLPTSPGAPAHHHGHAAHTISSQEGGMASAVASARPSALK